MLRVAFAIAACLIACRASAGPPQIDRTIAKEPAYKTKAPQYGLLAFGPDAKDRVWLVRDGGTLYVDRNGNGDLTEPGEKIAAEKAGRDKEEDGYSFEVGDVTVGGRTHKALRVSFGRLHYYANGPLGRLPALKAVLAKDPKALGVSLSIDADVPGLKGGGLGGRITFIAGAIDLDGVLQFADKPAAAPVVRLGGPLELTSFIEPPTLRVGRSTDLVLIVGTRGIGPGTFAEMAYEDTIPADAKPVAEISFSPSKPGAPPLDQKYEIKQRC
jgi:hypothetical protein